MPMSMFVAPNGRVHPVAAILPMLGEDELAELAADIAERGLLNPIVLDRDGTLLDGRNRLAACTMAGIAPCYTLYEGDDAAGYALAVNIKRRHLTQGQRAMAVATSFTLFRGETSLRRLEQQTGVNKSGVSKARLVLEWAPELVQQVLGGGSLPEAYGHAQERKVNAARDARALETASERYPDIAASVRGGRMTTAQALAAIAAADDADRQEAAMHAEREAVQLAIEAAGTPVPIPPEPHVMADHSCSDIVGSSHPLEGDGVRRQKTMLGDMALAVYRLQMAAKAGCIVDGWAPSSFRQAVHAYVTQIVAEAYGIDEAYSQAFADSRRIRSMK